MRKYIVLPIGRIINFYPQICEKLGYKPPVIVATQYPYYEWEETFTPLIHFSIADVYEGHPDFITYDDVLELKKHLPALKENKCVIVGCDAGISRSSAIAYSLAKIFKEKDEVELLGYWYPHRNQDMIDYILRNIGDKYAQRTLQTTQIRKK